MNNLIPVNTSGENPTVLGRDLHETLKVETPYSMWMPRMIAYGFIEGTDFLTINKSVIRADGVEMPQTQVDHQLTIDAAKEIAMLQRTDKGKEVRQYFIELEKKWNDPVSIMARALQYAEKQIDSLKNTNATLLPKAEFYDAVIESTDTIEMATVAKILNVGIGRNRLFEILREQKILRDDNTPLQNYVDLGWFKCVESKYTKPDGGTFINVKTVVYQKGIDGILKLLKEKYGLVPKIVA